MSQKLFNKYIVRKADGSPIDPLAQYFVLRIDTDEHARVAVLAYASSIEAYAPEFAMELRAWVEAHQRGKEMNETPEDYIFRIARIEFERLTKGEIVALNNAVSGELDPRWVNGYKKVTHLFTIEDGRKMNAVVRRAFDLVVSQVLNLIG